MPAPSNKRVELSPELERHKRISVPQAAELRNISADTFRRRYRHLIRQESPRRQTVKLGDVLDDWDEKAPESIGLSALLAALPASWRVEVDHRVRHANTFGGISEKIAKALRHALSTAKTEVHDHQTTSAVRAINNILTAAGCDLNDIDGVTITRTASRVGRAA
jgi:hypothetical protein